MIWQAVASLMVLAAFGIDGTTLGPKAQTAGPTPAPTGTGFILGRVVDATSGAPIDDALVTVGIMPSIARPMPPRGGEAGANQPPAKPLRAVVNGRGQFVFTGLPAGSAQVTASAAGYISGGAGVRVPGGEPVAIVLNDGQHVSDVTIRLWRLASVDGTVVDETGDPIADVPVRLLERTAGERRLVAGPVVNTDDQGAFRFPSLQPGRYVVLVQSTTTSMPASVVDDYVSQLNESVSPLVRGPVTAAPQPSVPGFRVGDTVLQPSSALARDAPAPGPDGGLLIYRTTFYPEAPTLSQAQAIDVVAGDDRSGINLTLPLVRTAGVSGIVTESAGPTADMTLRLVPSDAEDWVGEAGVEAAWTTTDAEGAFTFLGVPPGQYVIEGRANHLWTRLPVSVANAPVAGLALTAHPNLRVSGRVRFSGTSRAPTLGEGVVSLVEVSGSVEPQRATIAAGGEFSIDDCQPGRYALQVPMLTREGASWAVESITENGRDLRAEPLDLESDVSDIVVSFTDRPTTISGAVRLAGQPDEPLAVVVFPADYQTAEDSGLFELRSATAAVVSGQYVVQGLAPGTYLIAAIPQSELAIWAGAGPLHGIAAQASTVTLTDRSHVTIDLKAVEIK